MTPNPDIDIVTLDQAKDWVTLSQSVDADENLQVCITAASLLFLHRTGQGNPDGSVPPKSPLVQQVDFTQWYDGNGSDRQFVRNTPIISVTLLTVDGLTVPESSGETISGWVIDGSRKSIALRGRMWRFERGIQNVKVVYRAGHSYPPEDLQLACLQLIALNFHKRKWVGQAQVAQPDSFGTIVYRDWAIPPEVNDVIKAYTRRAVV